MEKPKMINTMAIVTIILTFAFISVQLFIEIPEANKDTINVINGVLMSTGFVAIIQFYFGSSTGSETKNETIKNLSENNLTK